MTSAAISTRDEDETGIVNAVVWPKLFERQRRLVLSSSMLAINGKIQREGDVVPLVAQRLFDLSEDRGRSTLPITAPQVLWVNMVTSVALGLTISFEPHKADVMRRPPRSVDRPGFGVTAAYTAMTSKGRLPNVRFGQMFFASGPADFGPETASQQRRMLAIRIRFVVSSKQAFVADDAGGRR